MLISAGMIECCSFQNRRLNTKRTYLKVSGASMVRLSPSRVPIVPVDAIVSQVAASSLVCI
jgi:hypothetical protein